MELNKLDNIKIGLLGTIAATLVVNVFIDGGTSTASTNKIVQPPSISNIPPPVSNLAAPNNNLPSNTVELTDADPTTFANFIPEGPFTKIQYAEKEYDFGQIYQNSTDNKHIFKFTNQGDVPLTIYNARGSCGCTVPSWPKEPILPGESGEIVVDYKPGTKKGAQQQKITITANTEPNHNTRIIITSEVLEKEDETEQ